MQAGFGEAEFRSSGGNSIALRQTSSLLENLRGGVGASVLVAIHGPQIFIYIYVYRITLSSHHQHNLRTSWMSLCPSKPISTRAIIYQT